MDPDPFRKHANRMEGRSFQCKYCEKVMKSGGSRKIKYHLAGVVGGAVHPCDKVTPEIRQEAKEALATVRRYNRRSGSTASAAPAPPVEVLAIEDGRPVDDLAIEDGRPVDDLIEIQRKVEEVMKIPKFLHQLPSAVYYYLNEKVASETNIGPIPKALENLFQRSSPPFKALVHSYAHMKKLLANRHLIDEPTFSPDCEVMDANVGSTRYRELVRYLIKEKRFWEDGERFVKRFEPFLQLTANIALSGCTIGHMFRAAETAKSDLQVHDQVEFDKQFGNASHLLAKTAALLDPAFIYDMDLSKIDAIDAMNQLSQFSDLYVLDEDQTRFVDDVKTYLSKDKELFHSSARSMKDDSHPRRWWLYCTQHVEVLRKYAFNLVSLPLSTNLEATHANRNALSEPLSRKERPEDEDLHQYQVADLVPFESWVLHGEDAAAGLLASWELLKKLNQYCWRLIPDGEYWNFCFYASESLKGIEG